MGGIVENFGHIFILKSVRIVLVGIYQKIRRANE
jgi:hypothetical protein